MEVNKSKKNYYTNKAKQENYPARSVYKLQEIDKEFNLVKRGGKVLDLGASPGSWMLYLSDKVGDNGKVVGVDVLKLKIEVPANCVFLEKDILDENFLNEIDGEFDLVVSDLAPNTSGIKFLDEAKSLELCQKAFEIVKKVLKKDGSFLFKIFESKEAHNFAKELKSYFSRVSFFRPKATRKGSKEIFVICETFKGF